MFTGLVEEVGILRGIERGRHSARLDIGAKIVLEGLRTGDSIAVNGVCLTVTSFGSQSFQADVMHETLNRSALGDLGRGSPLNLERALPANGRFGGHIVAGHVDGTGVIQSLRQDDTALLIRIRAEASLLRYVVEKGSIAIDGVSLTVAAVSDGEFSVSLIPHSAGHTTLGRKQAGDRVNLETDILGKYIEKLFSSPATEKGQGGITREFLTQYGF